MQVKDFLLSPLFFLQVLPMISEFVLPFLNKTIDT